MSSTRCEEAIVQLVIRSYDDAGRPIREQVTEPLKVFRNAETHDFWKFVDKGVADIKAREKKPIADITEAIRKGRK